MTIGDYPAASLDAREEGVIDFTYHVDTSGRVDKCVISRSTASALLNAVTCRLFMQRHGYIGFHDLPVAVISEGSRKARYVWRLPAYVAFPAHPLTAATPLTLDGKLTPNQPLRSAQTSELKELVRGRILATVATVEGKRSFVPEQLTRKYESTKLFKDRQVVVQYWNGKLCFVDVDLGELECRDIKVDRNQNIFVYDAMRRSYTRLFEFR